MKKCAKCGTVLIDNAKFCFNCGEPVTQDAAAQSEPARHYQGYQDPSYIQLLEKMEREREIERTRQDSLKTAQAEAAAPDPNRTEMFYDGPVSSRTSVPAHAEREESKDTFSAAASFVPEAGKESPKRPAANTKVIPILLVTAILVLLCILAARLMHGAGAPGTPSRDSVKDIAWSDPVLELRMREIMDNDSEDFMPADAWDLEELDLGPSYSYNGSSQYPGITDISALQAFGSLKKLNLSGNEIEKIDALGSLANLTELNLYNTNAVDLSPLKKLKKLETLSVSVTKDGQKPDLSVLSEIPSLKSLSVSGMEPDINLLKKIEKLDSLYLSNTTVTELQAISEMKQLTSFGLSSAELDDDSPLAGMTQLRELNLYNVEIGDLSFLSRMKDLESLSLGSLPIADLSFLSELKKLKEMSLSTLPVSDFHVIESLPSLETLTLGSQGISDLSFLSGKTSLKELSLYDNAILDLSALSGLNNLEKLNLGSNNITDISPLSGMTKL